MKLEEMKAKQLMMAMIGEMAHCHYDISSNLNSIITETYSRLLERDAACDWLVFIKPQLGLREFINQTLGRD